MCVGVCGKCFSLGAVLCFRCEEQGFLVVFCCVLRMCEVYLCRKYVGFEVYPSLVQMCPMQKVEANGIHAQDCWETS